MSPKLTRILYWTVNILFGGFMIMSGVFNAMVNEDSIMFLHDMLGYPVYFISFLGWAKIIGGIVILIPGLKRIKEWAYAGLFFDLAGATYSVIAVEGLQPAMAPMLVFFALGGLPFMYYHKRLEFQVAAA